MGWRDLFDWIREAGSVVVDAARLLWRHWPALLTVFLLGAAARGAALWGAVLVGRESSFVAAFVLPLGPLAALTALVVMFRVLVPSLRQARDPDRELPPAPTGRRGPPARQRMSQRLGLLASVLVPFLGLYAAQGHLEADRRFYINRSVYDELEGGTDVFTGGRLDSGRAVVASGLLLALVIAVTLLVRRLLTALDLPGRHLAWGLVAAYVEVYWLFSVVKAWGGAQTWVVDWISGRAAVAWAEQRWEAVLAWLGPVGRPVRAAGDWVVGLLGDLSAVVLVPLGWLAVGAVVFGRSLPPRSSVPSQPRRRGRLGWARERVTERVDRLPGPVARWVGGFGADLRDRFRNLREGLALLARGGLTPMLAFCIVFALTRWVDWGVAELARLVLGPRPAGTGLAFSPIVGVVAQALSTVLLVTLVAAAVDRMLSRAPAERHTGATATTP